jgi:hypothetical protein
MSEVDLVKRHPRPAPQRSNWATTMAGEDRVKERKTGRGERDSPATTDLPVTMRLAEPPEPCEWLRSA